MICSFRKHEVLVIGHFRCDCLPPWSCRYVPSRCWSLLWPFAMELPLCTPQVCISSKAWSTRHDEAVVIGRFEAWSTEWSCHYAWNHTQKLYRSFHRSMHWSTRWWSCRYASQKHEALVAGRRCDHLPWGCHYVPQKYRLFVLFEHEVLIAKPDEAVVMPLRKAWSTRFLNRMKLVMRNFAYLNLRFLCVHVAEPELCLWHVIVVSPEWMNMITFNLHIIVSVCCLSCNATRLGLWFLIHAIFSRRGRCRACFLWHDGSCRWLIVCCLFFNKTKMFITHETRGFILRDLSQYRAWFSVGIRQMSWHMQEHIVSFTPK